MEDFAARENKGIKEKSIYILHLDTPRIIIISSVIAGLLIISVLIGMNISKHDEADNIFHDNTALDNLITDNSEKPNSSENNIDPSLNNENILKNTDIDNNIISTENSIKPKNSINNMAADNSASKDQNIANTSDILIHENIETIIPPSNAAAKSDIKKPPKRSTEIRSDKSKESKKKKGIIEVSSADKFDWNSEKSYFSIQVAAFDRKSKAQAEITNLENKKYNAYLENGKVNGKTYYRVMIGPIYSKKKASDLLEEISSNNRYGESYIIKR